MNPDTSLQAAFDTGTTMATIPEIQSTAYGTTYTVSPEEGGGGDTPIPPIPYDYVPWGNITGNINDQKDLINALITLREDVIETIEQQIGDVIEYKGQVATYEDLPNNAEKGDCYNVADTGANYIWNGTTWDKLSETYDFSIFATKAEVDALLELYYTKQQLDTLIENLQEVIDNKLAEKVDVTQFEQFQEEIDDTMAGQTGNIQSLLLQMDTLEQKIEDLKSLDYEIVELYDGSETQYTNEQKSFVLSGSVTAGAKVTGENVTLDEATVYGSCVEFIAIQDITMKLSTFQGTVYKAVSNAMIKLHADDYISVRDCTLVPEVAYNGMEIDLNLGLAKSVIIDNVNFDGTFTNNGISIFGMDDGGVVTISNCHFHKLSNVLRLSNRTNTTWTVNLINCTVDEWEPDLNYTGMILLQDYTSGSSSAAEMINMFNKLTINIQNCTKPDGTKITMPEDLSTICGSRDANQIIYMYDEWRGHTAYDVNKYPHITIN